MNDKQTEEQIKVLGKATKNLSKKEHLKLLIEAGIVNKKGKLIIKDFIYDIEFNLNPTCKVESNIKFNWLPFEFKSDQKIKKCAGVSCYIITKDNIFRLHSYNINNDKIIFDRCELIDNTNKDEIIVPIIMNDMEKIKNIILKRIGYLKEYFERFKDCINEDWMKLRVKDKEWRIDELYLLLGMIKKLK